MNDGIVTRSRNVGEGEWNYTRYAVSLFRDLYKSMVSGSVVFHSFLLYHNTPLILIVSSEMDA